MSKLPGFCKVNTLSHLEIDQTFDQAMQTLNAQAENPQHYQWNFESLKAEKTYDDQDEEQTQGVMSLEFALESYPVIEIKDDWSDIYATYENNSSISAEEISSINRETEKEFDVTFIHQLAIHTGAIYSSYYLESTSSDEILQSFLDRYDIKFLSEYYLNHDGYVHFKCKVRQPEDIHNKFYTDYSFQSIGVDKYQRLPSTMINEVGDTMNWTPNQDIIYLYSNSLDDPTTFKDEINDIPFIYSNGDQKLCIGNPRDGYTFTTIPTYTENTQFIYSHDGTRHTCSDIYCRKFVIDLPQTSGTLTLYFGWINQISGKIKSLNCTLDISKIGVYMGGFDISEITEKSETGVIRMTLAQKQGWDNTSGITFTTDEQGRTWVNDVLQVVVL